VWQRRDRGEQLGRDVLVDGEQFLRLEPGSEPGVDEVLALDREQP